jgi:potassium-dependent mechanosensitive channel
VLRTNRDRLARRLIFVLGVTVALVWIHSTLKLFTVREGVYEAISSALNYQIKVGSASFSVSNFVAFVLTLVIGYLVASVIRAILSEGILPRLTLAHGLPNAIATITHYVLLVLIFFFALAAAGVELSKFTIMTGALGVGLGFGLQNVVNNFVSGLILLFERPVRVGDLLEVKGVGGQVTKIGFRSSTLHAFDGSDVIIPNATLTSEQVTNWTLTGTRRQILLNVHVAYGNDPTNVRDLLHKTVADQSDVLKVPAPTALFLGFGDNALNFEVRFWAPRPEVVPELKSEVALSIARALSEASIKVPAPQQLQITGPEQAEKQIAQEQKKGAAGS